MRKFDDVIKDIKERADKYLIFKAKMGLTHDNHGLKYWRNKRLVDIESWEFARINYKFKELIKYMPEKFVDDPLNIRNYLDGRYFVDYDEWLWDYGDYLITHCGESDADDLWDKIAP